MKTIVALIAALFVLSGCAALRGVAQEYQSAERIAMGVDQYCLNVTEVERLKNREAINKLAKLGQIEIRCNSDAE